MAFQDVDRQFKSIEERAFDDHIAGATIFVIAVVGVLANAFVVFVIARRPSMQNAFGRLTQNQGVADLLASLIYLFYYAPMIFLNIKVWKTYNVSKWLGDITTICYETGNLTHFFASINRIMAIFMPVTYSARFGMRTALGLSIFAWAANIVPGFTAYRFTGCDVVYSDEFWHWHFETVSDLCYMVGMYYDFAKNVIIMMIILTLDMITFLKCRRLRIQLRDTVHRDVSHSRKMDENNFVTQALLQGILFAAELLSYFFVVTYIRNNWVKFVFSQVFFQLIHTMDGIITIVFNKELRKWWRGSTSTVSGSNTGAPRETNPTQPTAGSSSRVRPTELLYAAN